MPEEGVHETPMPAVSLAPENSQGSRYLRPGDWVGNKGDLVRFPLLFEIAVHAGDNRHVLAHGIVGVATGFDKVPAAEHTERP